VHTGLRSELEEERIRLLDGNDVAGLRETNVFTEFGTQNPRDRNGHLGEAPEILADLNHLLLGIRETKISKRV
jgi:hypothetical protein